MTTDVEALITRLREDAGFDGQKLLAADALRVQAERIAGLLDQHARDSAELRRLCGERDFERDLRASFALECKDARIEIAAKDAKIAALESSQGHLRDALRVQSDKIQSMALGAISDAERIQALEAKCAELERDAGRYRWMRSRGGFLSMTFGTSPEQFDAAVDAAIAAQTRSKDRT